MLANPVKRYFWLVDTIYRHAPISFKEIAERWEQSALYDNKKLAIRTFHNHREAIEELFHVRIVCDDRTNKYFIADQGELAKNGLSSWLLNAFSMSNILTEAQSLGSRVQVEEIPSAQHHLTELLMAMRENRCVKVTYQPFVAEAPFELMLQPLFVKRYDCRWYLYANKRNEEKIKLYALDRMHTVEAQEERFVFPADFDPAAYTCNAFGVAIYDEISPCKIRVRAYGRLAAYLRTLPLHQSQREVETTNRYADFEYFVAPTQELYLKLMSYGRQIEVLSPEKVRNSIHWKLMQAAVIYDKELRNENDK
ncbi:MAG: WYL domain-containing protein [Muribaculaceae bacterium]|nr:WYL domain-containing protein [Muribaculaceae bacterium]